MSSALKEPPAPVEALVEIERRFGAVRFTQGQRNADAAAKIRIADDLARVMVVVAAPRPAREHSKLTPNEWLAQHGGNDRSFSRCDTPACCDAAVQLSGCVCGVAYGCLTHGVTHMGSHD